MPAHTRHRTLTRRSFIKTSAATGASLAAGTVFAPAVHAQARTIKLGYVSPQTGPLAPFAEADNFILGKFRETVKGGIKIGNATHPVEVIVKDSQSNPNRAAEVAKELIVRDKVDLMLVASTPETTNPVSTQCEIDEVACISTVAPWQPWFIGQQANPGRRPARVEAVQLHLSLLLGPRGHHRRLHQHVGPGCRPTSRSAACSPTTATATPGATSRSASRRCWRSGGYKLTDPGRYQNLTDNFSAQITAFKNANCEIVTGVVIPPDFTTFWKQALQQGFKPKVASVGKALLFPVAVEALGKDGNNLSSEVWWSPSHPFKSSLNGMSAKAAGRRLHGGHQEAVDAAHRLRARAVRGGGGRAQAHRARSATPRRRWRRSRPPTSTRWSARLPWNGANLPPFAAKNVAKTPLVGGQWRIKDGNKYDIVITDNRTAPAIPVGGKMEAIA